MRQQHPRLQVAMFFSFVLIYSLPMQPRKLSSPSALQIGASTYQNKICLPSLLVLFAQTHQQTGFWEMDYAYVKAIEGPIVDGVGLGYPGFFALPGQVSRVLVVGRVVRVHACCRQAAAEAAAAARVVSGPVDNAFDRPADMRSLPQPPGASSCFVCVCMYVPPHPPVVDLFFLQALESEAAWSRFVRNGRVQLRCEVTDCE